MPIKVRIPTPLRKLTHDADVVETTPPPLPTPSPIFRFVIPASRNDCWMTTVRFSRFVNVYVNEEDIRFLQNQQTAIKDGDEISIIPAIAGG